MKRSAFFGIFTLLLGFFLGSLCPSGLFPWSSLSPFRATSAVNSSPPPPANDSSQYLHILNVSQNSSTSLDTKDNTLLLQAACSVISALRDEDYAALADMVHSELGVTFTPYSTVDLVTDLTFTSQQIRTLSSNQQVYIWGIIDGRGDPIEMTMLDYVHAYVFNEDYSRAPQVAIDQVQHAGNALENASEIYSSGRFVEFHFPSIDQVNAGMDWCSLKTVFLPEGNDWKLVALIHRQWTT